MPANDPAVFPLVRSRIERIRCRGDALRHPLGGVYIIEAGRLLPSEPLGRARHLVVAIVEDVGYGDPLELLSKRLDVGVVGLFFQDEVGAGACLV